ncbi:S-Ena type endospore appendage [Bacillus cereus group sp. BfR-BA-01331]|uniref:S-Ena type endospore appendage n=1 Tax=Bacillus cereus group sp. BfR-BA-01331 TaxID=2920307 RepID=UPI0037C0A841
MIKINLCQSLRKPCEQSQDTIFSSPIFPSINGVFTVSNAITICTINLFVTDARRTSVSYTIPAHSSIAIAVNNVSLIQYNCSGDDPATFCTGAFEANFYYCVSC